MTIKEQIIKLCLDDTINGIELVQALEKQIVGLMPYDHSSPSPLKSCNIPKDDLKLEIEGAGCFSEVVEKIEDSLTKRELSLILFDRIIVTQQSSQKSTTFLESLFGGTGSSDRSTSDSECHEEDNSECWKCSKQNTCKKFKK